MSAPLHVAMLSHLTWDRRLFQRPQHLATQLAAAGDTVSYFSVEPLRRYLEFDLRMRVQNPAPRLEAVMLPQVPGSWRFERARRLTEALVRAKARGALRGGTRVLWCQHPRFAPIAESLPVDSVVYDAMDPHRAFRSQDPRTAEFEERLLRRADVVFAGGHSMARPLLEVRPDTIVLPSGIDYAHFAAAAEPGVVPRELETLRKPVLGYFGAVDERIDWDLLAHVARERRNWSIVLIGPLVLMRELPIKEQNVYHFGARDYARLPDYLRGFDVCLIPWRVTELTRCMSPTKTPEYLAAGRPVVSTRIPDVELDYGGEVLIGDSPDSYLNACTTALLRGRGPARKPPQSRTWNEIATAMREAILAKLAAR